MVGPETDIHFVWFYVEDLPDSYIHPSPIESSEECQVIAPLNISIPLSYFINHPVPSLEVLHQRLHMFDTISEGS